MFKTYTLALVPMLQSSTLKLVIARYIGFAFCATSILLAMARVLGDPPLALYGVTVALSVGAVVLGGMTPQTRPYWIAVSSAIVVAYCPVLFSGTNFVSTACAVAAWIGTLFCLAAFRESIVPYLLWGSAVGILFEIFLPHSGIGVSAALAFLLILALINYVYMLYLDHRKDFFASLAPVNMAGRFGFILRAAVLWLPAALLAWLGLEMNLLIQQELKVKVYETGLLCLESSPRNAYSQDGCAHPFVATDKNGNGVIEDAEKEFSRALAVARDPRIDALHTVDVREQQAIADFEREFDSMLEVSNRELGRFPDDVKAQLAKHPPPDIDEHRACRNSKFRAKGIKISLRGLCRDMVRSVESAMKNAHRRTVDRINAKVAEEAARGTATIDSVSAAARAAGIEEIRAAFQKARTGVVQTFMALWFLTMLSYLMLLAGLVAAYQLILGRLLFDAGRKPTPVFRLDPEGDAMRLDFRAYNELSLKDREDSHGPTRWYVALGASRQGVGTFMRLTIPGARRCLLQRLFSGKLLMTKIDMRSKEVRDASAEMSPRLSLAGDLKLVAFKLAKGQEIVFRMRDLIAHSSGVKLRAVYSTHVGAHLLGLGTFYAVASGAGDLVVQSEGEEVFDCLSGNTHQGSSFLAWDRRHRFSLAQTTTFSGIWFNEPSLRCESVTGAAIVDESKPNKAPIARRIWSLIRYLFIPL